MRLAAVLVTLSAGLPAPLHAQAATASPNPLLVPTRDVDVIYKIAEDQTERMRWQVSAGRLRVDTPLKQIYVLVNLNSRQVAIVNGEARTVEDTISAGLPVPAAGPGGFSRGPSAEVGGLPCTEWSTDDGAGHTVVSCLTSDGVLLRSRLILQGAGQGASAQPPQSGLLLEATSVTYGPIDPNIFTIPPDYTHVKQDPPPP